MTQPIIINDYPARKGGTENIAVNPGRIAFILGKSGAGKTALLEEIEKQGAFFARPAKDFTTVGAFLVSAAKRHAKWDASLAAEAMEEFHLTAEADGERAARLASYVEALACREDFVLIDDPVTGNEDKDRKMLYMLLRDFCRGECAFVVAVQDIIDAEFIIDDVVFLENGKLLVAEDRIGLLKRTMYVSGHCKPVEVHTDGLEKYGEKTNGKITTVVCLMPKNEIVAGSCDVSVQNIRLQTLYDFMTAK